MIFERSIYQDLLKWKKESNGKTAMLVEGARRIGKSTVVETFAKKEYKSYITGVWYDEVNLFQQKLPEQLWGNIRTFIKNLRDLPLWKDRSMSSTVFGGKSTYDFWKTIFVTGRTPDGIIVLSKPLNVADMIRN